MSSNGVGANVFITGANRGIGLGLIGEFIKVGGVKNIFAGCRDPNNAKDLRDLQVRTNNLVKLVQIDVQSEISMRAAFAEVKKTLGSGGSLNVLINNAAVLETKGVGLLDPERIAYNRHFDVNSTGPAIATAVFLPLLRQAATSNQPTKVVSISSGLGSASTGAKEFRGNIVYGMSKAALNHYTRAIADVESNIIFVALDPGWVRTDMGGSEAALSVDESVGAIIKTISGLTKAMSGTYIDRLGNTIPY